MKKVLLGLLICGLSFAAPTSYGGIAIVDKLVIDASADLAATTMVSSRNGTGAVVSTVNVYQLPSKYSLYHFDSTTNTLNVELVTSNLRVDGQIIVLDCIGFSKPISITTNIYITAPATPNGAPSNADSIIDTSTANLTIDAAGDAIMLQYVKSKGQYMILSNDL